MSEVPGPAPAGEPPPPSGGPMPYAQPVAVVPVPARRSRPRLFWGLVFIVVGAVLQLNNLGLLWWMRADVVWPALVILLGLLLLVRSLRR